jgi:hypothetical protein
MTAILKWMTADPARAFAAGAATWAVASLLPVPWLPAGLVVLALLAGGARLALPAVAGATLLVALSVVPVSGALSAGVIVVAVLLPAYLAGRALAASRSLNLVYQWLTLGAALLVLAIHALVGDPVKAMMPFMSQIDPLLQQLARWLTERGIETTPAQIGTEVARIAWRTLAWAVVANALIAQFLGLWAFGRLQEPGLFGREFRRLRLGGFIAWSLAACFVLSVVLDRVPGAAALVVDDLVFVLAAGFLVQALAVVHGLRELQVIGVLPIVLAYAAIVVVPMALVGIGFADTWFRFRERFAKR